MRHLLIALAVLFGLALAACTSDETVVVETGSTQGTTQATNSPTTEGESPDPTLTGGPDFDPEATEPPPIVITRGDASLELMAWTYCWTPPAGDVGICADGFPPTDVPVLAGEGPIEVVFPGDFAFSVRGFDEAYTVPIEGATITNVGGTWRIEPGPEGPTVFEVFGNGPEGDVIVTFAVG